MLANHLETFWHTKTLGQGQKVSQRQEHGSNLPGVQPVGPGQVSDLAALRIKS